jgi:hypothetical protein
MRSSASSFAKGDTERSSFVHRAQRTNAVSFWVAVINFFLKVARPAEADWRQQLPRPGRRRVAPGIGSERILAEEALANRQSSLRLGDMRNAAGLHAGLAVPTLAAVGDDGYRIDPENVAGRVGGCVSRPMPTIGLVTACSTIILFFAWTAICAF